MLLPAAVSEQRRAQARLIVQTRREVHREWQSMGRDFNASWGVVGPRLTHLVTLAQASAAQSGSDTLDAVLRQINVQADLEAEPVPRRLAGASSDGRPLESLLYGGVVKAGEAYDAGATQHQALAAGRSWLDMAVMTQLSDAARMGQSIGMAARPQIMGYVRTLSANPCSRCAILGGRWYRWNAGFERHPRCDCGELPAPKNMARDLTNSPEHYFDSLSASEQDRVFTKAGAQAIRDGADINQVVNARRGMSRAQSGRMARQAVYGKPVYVTTEGVTKRGFAGSRMRGGFVKTKASRYTRSRTPRLMPESIYEIAEDRADAIRLLKKYGYLM